MNKIVINNFHNQQNFNTFASNDRSYISKTPSQKTISTYDSKSGSKLYNEGIKKQEQNMYSLQLERELKYKEESKELTF